MGCLSTREIIFLLGLVHLICWSGGFVTFSLFYLSSERFIVVDMHGSSRMLEFEGRSLISL